MRHWWRARRVYFLALLVPPKEGRPDSCSLPAKTATTRKLRAGAECESSVAQRARTVDRAIGQLCGTIIAGLRVVHLAFVAR